VLSHLSFQTSALISFSLFTQTFLFQFDSDEISKGVLQFNEIVIAFNVSQEIKTLH